MTPQERDDLHFRYYKEGKLHSFPSQRSAQLRVLRLLVERFEKGRRYTEKEVNGILKAVTSCRDPAFFRRELIDCRLLARERDCSAYWRGLTN